MRRDIDSNIVTLRIKISMRIQLVGGQKLVFFRAMQVYRGLNEVKPVLSGCGLTWGNFDGVHLGHQRLIEAVIERSRQLGVPSAVLSFDPHPQSVLHPEGGFRPLFPREDLVEQMDRLGVDVLILEPFQASFAQIDPDVFVQSILLPPLGVRAFFVGHDLGYGRDRAGDIHTLRRLVEPKGIEVHLVAPLDLDGEVISSRLIRRAVSEGRMEIAQRMLGRPFCIRGKVQKGDGRGRNLGFPTANLALQDLVIPKRGVYVTQVHSESGDHSYPSVTNVGVAPTLVAGREVWVETHILDQDLHLYGSELRVEFLQYLREERRFGSLAELRAQIDRDSEAARRYFLN